MTNNKTVGQLQPVRKTKPRGKANAVGIFLMFGILGFFGIFESLGFLRFLLFFVLTFGILFEFFEFSGFFAFLREVHGVFRVISSSNPVRIS